MILRILAPAAVMLLAACGEAAGKSSTGADGATPPTPSTDTPQAVEVAAWTPANEAEVTEAYTCTMLLSSVMLERMAQSENTPADIRALGTTTAVDYWTRRSEAGADALGWTAEQKTAARQVAMVSGPMTEDNYATVRQCAAEVG